MTNKNIDALREAAAELAREAQASENKGQRMTIVRTECARLASKYVAHLAARSADNKESVAPEPVEQDESPRDVKMGEAFKEVGGWMNGGEMGYPTFGSMNALWAYTVKMIRSYEENKAYRASLAAPASAEPAQTVDDLQAALAMANARLAELTALPGGESESVDTPEFREMLRDYRGLIGLVNAKAFVTSIIAHINSHVARQVQAALEQPYADLDAYESLCQSKDAEIALLKAQVQEAREQALIEARAEIRSMQDNLETFGPCGEESARVALDGALDVIDDLRSPQEPASTGKGAK